MRAAVFYIEHTIHDQGQAEAGPQHGEAEDGTQPPRHDAGRGGCLCGDTVLATWTHHAHRVATQVYGWYLHYLDHCLDSW